ncbi:hypothetical protein CAPTEDRAFT_182794 [Capitella teleta]|uniref:EF-hand domain-containing protein n=1 Tax=Capitella teleta TaxID=283909 RepID=R7U5M2_CAPTE|nr:hypothetical protein CAPTEDRAFT_182794 [Capitella teleta]|eukprot:ELU01670.1 hypothetical protein CAPTEDRAFT_182794 [Capitella teleta]
MGVSDASNIEAQIRTLVLTRRIRPSEFFIDFDRLRSGFVTELQFFRVLWENLGLKLSPEQQQAIIAKYDTKSNGNINYRVFCEIINQPFQANDLGIDPRNQEAQAKEFLGTERSVQPLGQDEEATLDALLRNLQKYYTYRGINLRNCCEDFDRHHIGVIEESQFYRSFPRPPEVTVEDLDLLVKKYRHPERHGLVVYLNLHHDLTEIGKQAVRDEMNARLGQMNITDLLPPAENADVNLQQILDKIRVAVFKNRVRTTEFFKDYDRHKCGMITENQFQCGLALAIGKEAQLSRSEIQVVGEFYKQPNGMVNFKEFCDMLENAFNIPDLDKKPTQVVVRPPVGALGRNLVTLSDEEEARAMEVLCVMADQVRKRRLMMYQYFKDFDRSRAYSRVITQTQFGRILHFLSLNIAPEDFKLLCRKFRDAETGDVNYPAFVQTVDRDFVNYTQSQTLEESRMTPPPSAKTREITDHTISAPNIQQEEITYEDLMARIRHHVLTNRLRVIEFFQDYDTLRSGSISKPQFQRGLSVLGLSALGQHRLTDAQLRVLCSYYQSPVAEDKVLWTKFMQDIESVFTQPKDLEKMPSHKVPPQEIFRVPKPGTMDWRFASEDHKALHDQVMQRLQDKANQRRILTKPFFEDFDKHNNGYVTTKQFRQCLTMLDLKCTEPEMEALEARFCNDTGFNYIAFLGELQPTEKPKLMYLERQKEVREVNQRTKNPEVDPSRDLEVILLKIKNRVFKERIRIYEWMKDYDKLHTGRMLKINFRRALDLCKFELKESELAILEDIFQSPVDPDYVEYLQFCEAIENIFTKNHMEKTPLEDVQVFSVADEWTQNRLSEEMEAQTLDALQRIADQVRKNRVQLYPPFEDYDRVKNGTVSRQQFRRVLKVLSLDSLVPGENDWNGLWARFQVKIGGKNDVDYNSFAKTVYGMAGFGPNP